MNPSYPSHYKRNLVKNLPRSTRLKLEIAYVVVIVLCFVTAGASLVFSIHRVTLTDHKFCQIVRTVTSVKVPKPAHPAQDPSRERAYEFYMEFVDLGRSLGC